MYGFSIELNRPKLAQQSSPWPEIKKNWVEIVRYDQGSQLHPIKSLFKKINVKVFPKPFVTFFHEKKMKISNVPQFIPYYLATLVRSMFKICYGNFENSIYLKLKFQRVWNMIGPGRFITNFFFIWLTKQFFSIHYMSEINIYRGIVSLEVLYMTVKANSGLWTRSPSLEITETVQWLFGYEPWKIFLDLLVQGLLAAII